MSIDYKIYEDEVIEVKLFAKDDNAEKYSLFALAIRYKKPFEYSDKSGNKFKTTNAMGGETDWFILPASFGYVVAKSLIEQKVTGLSGFQDDGFKKMINWLVEMEEISDAMVY